MTPLDFFDAARAYCHAVNGSITSYYRTPSRNTMVGGHPHSKHKTWLACDVVPDHEGKLPDLERKAIANQLRLKLVVEGDHDHIQAY